MKVFVEKVKRAILVTVIITVSKKVPFHPLRGAVYLVVGDAAHRETPESVRRQTKRQIAPQQHPALLL